MVSATFTILIHSIIKVDKSNGEGDDDNTSTKLNHTKFINNLSDIKGQSEFDKEFVGVQKLQEIRKYLLKAKKGKDLDIKPGDHPEVKIAMEGDETYNPKLLYRKEGKVGGNTSTITYTPIDLKIDFTDDILNDPEAMENQLNKELGITIPYSKL